MGQKTADREEAERAALYAAVLRRASFLVLKRGTAATYKPRWTAREIASNLRRTRIAANGFRRLDAETVKEIVRAFSPEWAEARGE